MIEKCLEDSGNFLIDTQKKKMVKEERKNNTQIQTMVMWQ